MKEKKKIGLIPRLIIAIALGILVGQFLPCLLYTSPSPRDCS